MSRRTSEASKAIRKAWEKEQELVAEGKGTRDWTTEQQNEILEFGKAYYHSDDPYDKHDGDAFIGHHMKSAEAYPEYQGEPDNIQFLSYPEHQEAHKGNWQTPSNWYYDPVKKEYMEFGQGPFIPCEIINLSEPVRISAVDVQRNNIEAENTAQIAMGPSKEQSLPSQSEEMPQHSGNASHKPTTTSPPPKVHESFGDKILHIVKVVQDFGDRHPVLATVGKLAGVAGLAIAGEALASGGKKSGGGNSYDSAGDSYSSSADDYSSFSDVDNVDSSSDSRNNPDERSSPSEHTVPGHGQHYHTKEGVIWKVKEPYQRGGKHDD